MKKIKLFLTIFIFIFFIISLMLFSIASFSVNPKENIKIVEAIYGKSCGKNVNITKNAGEICNDKKECSFEIVAKDPAPGCAKDFTLKWTCTNKAWVYPVFFVNIEKEASGKVATINCN